MENTKECYLCNATYALRDALRASLRMQRHVDDDAHDDDCELCNNLVHCIGHDTQFMYSDEYVVASRDTTYDDAIREHAIAMIGCDCVVVCDSCIDTYA